MKVGDIVRKNREGMSERSMRNRHNIRIYYMIGVVLDTYMPDWDDTLDTQYCTVMWTCEKGKQTWVACNSLELAT